MVLQMALECGRVSSTVKNSHLFSTLFVAAVQLDHQILFRLSAAWHRLGGYVAIKSNQSYHVKSQLKIRTATSGFPYFYASVLHSPNGYENNRIRSGLVHPKLRCGYGTWTQESGFGSLCKSLGALHYCACRELLGLHVYRGYGRHTMGRRVAKLQCHLGPGTF